MSGNTELREEVIREANRHEDWSDEEIAAKVGCSTSYVGRVRDDRRAELRRRKSQSTLVGACLLLLVGVTVAHETGLL